MPLPIKKPHVTFSRVSRHIRAPEPIALETLREAVSGRSSNIDRTRAMALLRASDDATKYRDLEAVLTNEREPREMRLMAAANLGRIVLPIVVDILAANVGIADAEIRAVIFTALGRIGHAGLLPLLDQAGREDSGVARSAARFAASLLSHRLGLSGHELSIPRDGYLEPHGDSGLPTILRHADEADAEYCLQCLAAKPLGIELSTRHVYQMQVLRRRRLVILNRRFSNADSVSRLQREPAFLGVVAAVAAETGTYYPIRVLLTSPGALPRTIDICSCRLRGDVVLAGAATVDHDRATFVMRAISRPGARPTRIEGTFDNSELRFTTAFAATRVIDKRFPQPTEHSHG